VTNPRLLVVGPTPPPVHGVTVYVRMLLEASAVRDRWDVVHLDTSDRRSLENLGRIDVTNVFLALRHVAEFAWRMRRERVRAVWIPVSSNAPAYLRDAFFILVAHASGARVVTHLHGGGFREFYDRAPAAVRWLVRVTSVRVDRAWVLGEGLREMYHGLISSDRIRTVPNGVPDPVRGAPELSDDCYPITLLHMGQLSVAKGVVELIEAARRLRVDGADVRVVLAGPWLNAAEETKILAAIGQSGIDARVELAGVVTGGSKADLLARADIFVLATSYPYEGQPLAILEAMAAALPVVATPRAAIPDTVEDGVTGLLVPEGDTDALVAVLRRLANDVSLRRRLGEQGRRRWTRKFTADHVMARVVEALEEVRSS
jgi:glycosyltransferase involved in cell wall biosynthesis